MNDDKKRAMMAAHMCDEAARRFRLGDWVNAEMCASTASEIALSARIGRVDYVATLQALGCSPDQIDAAVVAILTGCHPASSLPGRVAKMRDSANRERRHHETSGDGRRADKAQSNADTCNAVLDLLGVKP